MQKLGSEVCAIRPRYGAKLRVKRYSGEEGTVAQRFENLAFQVGEKINFSLNSIIEAEP